MPVLTEAELEKEKQATHRKRRAALQARLKNRDEAKKRLDRAGEELKMAQSLVAAHTRTPGYVRAFEAAFAELAKAYNDINNEIPNELRNTCQDPALRDEFEERGESRRQMIREIQSAREAVKREDQNLASVVSSISQQRGEPARLQPGEQLPWATSLVGRVLGAMSGNDSPTWAICGEDIAFHPSVNKSNVEHYARVWREANKDVRLSKRTLADVERRLAEVESDFSEIKQRMIASAV